MDNEDWYLKPISSFVFLLDNRSYQKNILQKRFKKDRDGQISLYLLIEKIDSFGYEAGINFAFAAEHFKWIKGTKLHLLEIRKFHKLWRVITYLDEERKRLIMLDAFEAHNSKPMNKMIDQVSQLAKIAEELSVKEAR